VTASSCPVDVAHGVPSEREGPRGGAEGLHGPSVPGRPLASHCPPSREEGALAVTSSVAWQ
jgi:hypothetical protein